jgi:hypothetical protein
MEKWKDIRLNNNVSLAKGTQQVCICFSAFWLTGFHAGLDSVHREYYIIYYFNKSIF